YIPVDREVNPGSPLTAEELRRDPVSLLESSSQSPDSAYMPIPGLGRIRDPAYPSDSASFRSGGLPSRAQANELVHSLVDHVLPNIRRIPGRSAFNYHTGAPEYLSQNTANPIETAGAGLAGLGDAFVEIGRALQTIGGQWQGTSASDAEPQYTSEDMLSVLDSISELISATSVATPFLRSTPAQQTGNTTETWEGVAEIYDDANNGGESQNSRESARRHSYLVSSMFRRNYRRLAQSLLMLSSPRRSEDQSSRADEPPSSPLEQALRSLQNSLSILNSTVDRASYLSGSPRQQQQQQQSQNQREDSATRLQNYLNRVMDRRNQTRRMRQRQQDAANANVATVPSAPVSSSSETSNISATTASSIGSSNGSEDDALRNIVSRIEAGFSQMLQGQSVDFTNGNRVAIEVEAISLPNMGFQIINPPNHTHSTSQSRNPGPEGAPSNAAASVTSEAPDSPTVTTPRSSSPDSSIFGFIDRIGGMGSQTARSDRSNFSTTTEYSTNNGQTTRIPRIIAFTGGMGQPTAFSSGTNPFPFAT
ncbi:hypothetical protein LPJ73_006658, partial [Coemansia sp. RSA 2703]